MNAPIRRPFPGRPIGGGVESSDRKRFARLEALARWLARDRFERLKGNTPTRSSPNYPTSGDPDIIGEHEVEPVKCPCCDAALPWALIKGWRN